MTDLPPSEPQPAREEPDSAPGAGESDLAHLDALGALPSARPESVIQSDLSPYKPTGVQGQLTPTPLEPHQPITREGQRVWALDGLRGVAILGILPANLPSFAYPQAARDSMAYTGGGLSEFVAHAVLGTLVDVKFITLFAFLFGVGIALQTTKAERSNALLSFRPYFAWRLVLLAGIGLVHAIGLWYGDILFTYAACGMLVFALRSYVRVPGLFLGLGIMGIAMTSGLFLLFGLASSQSEYPNDTSPDRVTLLSWVDSDEGSPDHGSGWGNDAFAETWIHRHGSYSEQVTWRTVFWIMMMLIILFLYAWRLGGLMCLGVAAHEIGWIHEPPPRVLKIGVIVGLGLGLPLEAGFAYARFYATDLGPNMMLDGLHFASSIVLAAGYAAVCFSISTARWKVWPLRPLANAGRMALTVYLSETLLCTTLFYSYGLGYFGEPSRVQLWILTGVGWVVLLTGATLWLKFFRMGPVEWAWRSLATATAQPLLRRPAVQPLAPADPGTSGYPEPDDKELP